MKILFITGHRRSGTTLIGTLLDDANELCVYPGDISILYAYYPHYNNKKYSFRFKVNKLEKILNKTLMERERSTTKNINLSDSLYTYNADTTMEYSIDFSNNNVSDQIILSGSNLSLKGGNGGDSYTVIITVRGTQKFSDNFNFDNSDYNYSEQTFTVTLSDDDYIEGQSGTSSDDNITLTSGDDIFEYTFRDNKIPYQI